MEKKAIVDKSNRLCISILISLFILVSCSQLLSPVDPQNLGGPATHTPVSGSTSATIEDSSQTIAPLPSSTDTPSVEPFTPIPSSTETLIPSQTSTPTITPIPSITPTFAILRGKVLPEHANCRYGPGAPYLYKYGLVGGSNLEIIGRNDLGTWLLIQAIGGTNPCWVKAELMEVKGEIMAVEHLPPEVIQAWSPYYPTLSAVSAVRDNETVTVSWSPLVLRAGDDSEQVPYIVEAWVCQAGKLVFVPVGSYTTAALVKDEAGCTESSYGRVIAAEKHGYTWPVEIDWPQAKP